MRERAVEHVGDDFRVAVRPHPVAAGRRDAFLVQFAQRAERRRPAPAGRPRKAVKEFVPAMAALVAIGGAPDLEHGTDTPWDAGFCHAITV